MRPWVLEKNRRRFQQNREKNRAMTLVEVMIVLFILVVLATISVFAINRTLTEAGMREAKIFVGSMKGPLDLYRLRFGSYPTDADGGLNALINPPDGGEPFVDTTGVKDDPWGNPYNYQFPGQRTPNGYDLWSNGPDRIAGSDDDIGNWN